MSPVLRPAAAALLLTLAAAGGAQAHARLKSAAPAVGATVGPTSRLALTFSEGLVARFSTFELTGPKGATPVKVGVAGAVMTGETAAPLAPGAYTVRWRAVSDDTHRTQGGYGFTVK